MPFRRRKRQDIWHFCRNCSHWPATDFDEREVHPETGQFCPQCRAKRAAGECLG